MSNENLAPLSDKEMQEMELAMQQAAEAAQAEGVAPSGALGSVFGKLSNFANGLFTSSHAQAMRGIATHTSKQLVIQNVGLLLQKAAWAVIIKHTKELAKTNKVIYYAFHTKAGRAANTIVVCYAGALACLWSASYMRSRGKERHAAYLEGAATVLSYSSGVGIVEALDIPSIIDNIVNHIAGIGEEAGVDLTELVDEITKE